MPFEQHQEKNYPKDVQSIHQAALQAVEKLGGKIIFSSPEQFRFTARFPKVILGKTLGERTELSFETQPDGTGGAVTVDAFPLDALERKLMFGAAQRGYPDCRHLVPRASRAQSWITTGSVISCCKAKEEIKRR